MFSLNREQGTTLVLVTHDPDLAARCAHVVRLARHKGGVVNLVLRFVRRELRSTEARILVLALAVAVASVGAVAMFADRVRARSPTRPMCCWARMQ